MTRNGFVESASPQPGRLRRIVTIVASLLSLIGVSCRSPSQYRRSADSTAYKIVDQTQKQALGKEEPFSIERPSDILRRRLLVGQDLPRSSDASLGADKLQPLKHWPEKGYPSASPAGDPNWPVEPNKPVQISLNDVLQVGAMNSPDYQSQKENVFRTALALDL
jgi:hypothetical protein